MFKPPLVRKLDEGTKTQTRRLLPDPPAGAEFCAQLIFLEEGIYLGVEVSSDLWPSRKSIKAWKKVRYNGTVYLKEAYMRQNMPVFQQTSCQTSFEELGKAEKIIFPEDLGINSYEIHSKAERARYEKGSKTISFPQFENKMFMPCSAARKFYDMTPVRLHRISSITEEEAKAEGTELGSESSYQAAFKKLWDSIHKPGKRWSNDPWVIAYHIQPNQILNSSK